MLPYPMCVILNKMIVFVKHSCFTEVSFKAINSACYNEVPTMGHKCTTFQQFATDWCNQ